MARESAIFRLLKAVGLGVWGFGGLGFRGLGVLGVWGFRVQG